MIISKCKPNHVMVKTPCLLLLLCRIKSKHFYVAYKAVMIWFLPPPLAFIISSLPSLSRLQPHWPPLLSLGNLIPSPWVVPATVCVEGSTSTSSHGTVVFWGLSQLKPHLVRGLFIAHPNESKRNTRLLTPSFIVPCHFKFYFSVANFLPPLLCAGILLDWPLFS